MKSLKTKRLLLRDFTINDLNDFNEYATQPDVGPNAGWTPHVDIEESKKFLNMFINNGNEYAIVYNNKVIGAVGIHSRELNEYEIGYVMNHDYWGQGIMTEAVKAVVKHVLSSNNVKRLWCCHFDFNKRSKRVIEKCGFTYVRTVETNKYDKQYKCLEYCIDNKKND